VTNDYQSIFAWRKVDHHPTPSPGAGSRPDRGGQIWPYYILAWRTSQVGEGSSLPSLRFLSRAPGVCCLPGNLYWIWI